MDDMRRILTEWPNSIPRAGIAMSSFGEKIPFTNFMLCGDVALFEREHPDVDGGRRVMLPITKIDALKIIDAIEMSRFTVMGFQANAVGRQPAIV